MRKSLDTWQINMLLTGHSLGVEIPAPSKHCRAFMLIHSFSIAPGKYGHGHTRPSIFLNADHSDARFRIRVFEIDEAHIHFDTWDRDRYERDIASQADIVSIAQLEEALSAYLDDFSALVDPIKLGYC
ncbi:MAG: hypothetical protein OJF49_002244 [Ktedonobacterales bacterium]|jgi:hypothetical protein|nr:MAG: hypothetical protein OJF49_002244 [Ktedonobacterales bacterium]